MSDGDFAPQPHHPLKRVDGNFHLPAARQTREKGTLKEKKRVDRKFCFCYTGLVSGRVPQFRKVERMMIHVS